MTALLTRIQAYAPAFAGSLLIHGLALAYLPALYPATPAAPSLPQALHVHLATPPRPALPAVGKPQNAPHTQPIPPKQALLALPAENGTPTITHHQPVPDQTPLTNVPSPVATPPSPPQRQNSNEASSPPLFNAAYLDNPKPVYPLLAQRNGEEGKVILRVHVSQEGRVEELEISQSSGSVALDKAARRAVQDWRFIPAHKGTQAIAAWVSVPITFKLQD